MLLSCGIIIFNEFDEILLCHSTGNKFYDIPKGVKDAGELTIDCAIRECKEETGLTFEKSELLDLGDYDYNHKKRIHFYTAIRHKNTVDLDKLHCSTMFPHPISGRMIPECDGYIWSPFKDIDKYCAKSMILALRKLESIVKS